MTVSMLARNLDTVGTMLITRAVVFRSGCGEQLTARTRTKLSRANIIRSKLQRLSNDCKWVVSSRPALGVGAPPLSGRNWVASCRSA